MIKAGGAAVPGRSHDANGTVCQDAVASLVRGETACIALADGAGSRALSHIGATLTTRLVARMLVSDFARLYALARQDPEAFASSMVGSLQRSLARAAKRKGASIGDLACTLMFVACQRNTYVAGHIGDGLLVVRDGAQVSLLSTPENGEFSNSTFFLSDLGAHRRLRIHHGEVGARLGALLMSDGAADSLYDKKAKTLSSGGHYLIDWAVRLPNRRGRAMIDLNLRQVIKRRTTDDCALAFLVGPPA